MLRASVIGPAVFAGIGQSTHTDDMARSWIIIAHRKQEGTGAPLKEWYAVAIPDRVRAVEATAFAKEPARCHADGRRRGIARIS